VGAYTGRSLLMCACCTVRKYQDARYECENNIYIYIYIYIYIDSRGLY